MLDQVLADYRGLFADNTPLVNQRLKDIGDRAAAPGRLGRPPSTAGQVTAYRVGNTVTVTAPAGVAGPR